MKKFFALTLVGTLTMCGPAMAPAETTTVAIFCTKPIYAEVFARAMLESDVAAMDTALRTFACFMAKDVYQDKFTAKVRPLYWLTPNLYVAAVTAPDEREVYLAISVEDKNAL